METCLSRRITVTSETLLSAHHRTLHSLILYEPTAPPLTPTPYRPSCLFANSAPLLQHHPTGTANVDGVSTVVRVSDRAHCPRSPPPTHYPASSPPPPPHVSATRFLSPSDGNPQSAEKSHATKNNAIEGDTDKCKH